MTGSVFQLVGFSIDCVNPESGFEDQDASKAEAQRCITSVTSIPSLFEPNLLPTLESFYSPRR